MTAPRMTEDLAVVLWSGLRAHHGPILNVTRLSDEFARARSSESALLARVERLEGALEAARYQLGILGSDTDEIHAAVVATVDAALSPSPCSCGICDERDRRHREASPSPASGLDQHLAAIGAAALLLPPQRSMTSDEREAHRRAMKQVCAPISEAATLTHSPASGVVQMTWCGCPCGLAWHRLVSPLPVPGKDGTP